MNFRDNRPDPRIVQRSEMRTMIKAHAFQLLAGSQNEWMIWLTFEAASIWGMWPQ